MTSRSTDAPDEALVAAAVAGDRAALNELLAELRPKIIRYCRAHTGRAQSTYASADDIAQDVLIAVLKALPGYRATGAGFTSFVFGIAAHKVADFHRRNMRERTTLIADAPDVPDHSPGPEQTALRDELGKRLGTLLDTLPREHRDIVVLRLAVGLTSTETADAVASTSGAVRVTQHRALTKLRRLLNADGELPNHPKR
ncbi:RNA polymerase sigma-70 factor, ECF subfamily [Amycolatopsis marina]|uniref:RNA polymerase sigma-70 factor, ECF subfamily n=1 Tax=Amycolatopsis marina TaxID=490629 RepID=A0A1I0W777_9PSEU|nr:RNA polymerase sigma factor ShbA [Amycolatopsis marina]SFA84148.1 RNA polymerase sigma-70 factor, ECF subfamily [Amycolatopsis marina]